MTKTFVDIVGRDFTGSAFDSAGRKISSLDAGVISLTRSFTLLGGAAVAGFFSASTVRSITEANIQVQRFNNSLTVGTGSAEGAAKAMSFVRKSAEELGLDLSTSANQFSKLTAAAKGTALEGQATRDIFLGIAKASTVLGLSADQAGGALTAVEQIISKGKVSAEELRGQLGERLPGAFQIAARSIGVTTVELDKMLKAGDLLAEDLLPALAAELDKTFGDQAKDASQQLNANINRLNTAMFDLKVAVGNSGLIDFLTEATSLSAKLVKDLTTEGVANSTIFNAILGPIGFLREQAKQVRNSRKQIQQEADEVEKVFEKLENAVTPGSKPNTPSSFNSPRKTAISESQRFIASLKKEASQAGLTATQIKKLEAATLGVSKVANPLIDSIAKTNKELEDQQKVARALEDDLQKIESITQSVRTEEEKFADEVRELDRLLESGLGTEAYSRQLDKLEDQLLGTSDTTRKVTDEFSRLWDQAQRNVQSVLSNGIFNFFNDGLDGMVKNAALAVGRIASEFAALKIAQSVGIGSVFGGATSGGSSSNALSLAGIGSGISGGFSSLRSALTGGGSVFSAGSAGAGTAFIGGPGTAIGGAGTGAAGGLSLATGGLVVGAALLTDQFNKLIANDNKLFGASSKTLNTIINPLSKIPVVGKFLPDLGGILTGLFGRGELKQKETNLIGDFNSEGFEGATSVKFKAKGGVFSGSKTDRVINDTDSGELLNGFRGVSESGISSALNEVAEEAGKASVQLGEFLDTTVQGFSSSLRNAAKNLGLSTESIDNFSTSINIASEKGEALSEAQIAEVLEDISNQLSTGLIPEIDSLANSSETAFQAIVRINSEFDSLSNIMLLLGRSTEEAKNELRDLSITQRTELIDKLGGVQNANASFDSFFNNFLSPEDQLEILSEQLLTELQKVDINRIVSPQEVADAFRANSLSTDQLSAALSLPLQTLILSVDQLKTSAEGASQAVEEIPVESTVTKNLQPINDSFGALSRSIASEQKTIAEEITEVSRRMNDLSGVLRSAGSAINTINPVTKFAATSLIQEAINDSDFKDPRLGNAITALTKSSADGFSTRADFLRDQADSANTLRDLEDAAGKQLSLEEQTLSALESEGQQLEGILTNAQLQLDAINGVDSSIKSLADSLASFNTQSVGAGGNAVVGQGGSLPFDGNRNITGDQIRDFFSVQRTDQEIASEAARTGVTSNQILANTDFTNQDREDFFARNPNIPRFESGGFHSGGLRIVGENGPELEFTQPSRIASNSDSKKLLDNSEVVALLKQVLAAIKDGNLSAEQTATILDDVTAGGNAMLVEQEAA
ncbi:tape measure protein [uncultured Paraglaciecola sp.]|uniref:tape measure protein n=1 Tax=uncultured Paraglaciecola sp. TaxID=1765024 RepID=UPI002632485F|nr:tape measure protein [uncultured Paraglaciecola sp.]